MRERHGHADAEQQHPGFQKRVEAQRLRLPKIFNLRMDPYERADIVSDQYEDWLTKNVYLTEIGTQKAAAFLQTFVDYPPSQRPASFSIDQVQERVNKQIEEAMSKRTQK